MGQMFGGCSGLTSLDISGFNTSHVKEMEWMFEGCNSLTSLNLSKFDMSQIIETADMEGMFVRCGSLISIFMPASVKYATQLPDVSGYLWKDEDGTVRTETLADISKPMVYTRNSKVSWKSSNKKVASVNPKGGVTGKKKGKATITATAKDGSKKKAKITIKVK